jgi:hypothetical protein
MQVLEYVNVQLDIKMIKNKNVLIVLILVVLDAQKIKMFVQRVMELYH